MRENTMIVNKSPRGGGAAYISKALSKLTGSLLWGCRGDGAPRDRLKGRSDEMLLCHTDGRTEREREREVRGSKEREKRREEEEC